MLDQDRKITDIPKDLCDGCFQSEAIILKTEDLSVYWSHGLDLLHSDCDQSLIVSSDQLKMQMNWIEICQKLK